MRKVKLTGEGIKKLYQQLGVEEGVIKVKSGVICIDDTANVDVIQKIHRMYGVESIDDVPFEQKFINSSSGDELLKERIRAIGLNVRVGTIVRMVLNDVVKHVVVIAISGESYECAVMNLKVNAQTSCPENAVRLTKGKDVIYRNTTYKEVVEVTSKVVSNVKWQDFIKKSGGMIIGRIINELTLSQVQRLCYGSLNKDEKEDEQVVSKNIVNPIPEMVDSASEVHDDSCAHEEEYLSTEKNLNDSKKNGGENFDVSSTIHSMSLEEIIEEAKCLEELILKLKITTPYLVESMRICFEAQRCNLKSLYAELQKRVEVSSGTRQLSQNAIKNVLGQEFVEWHTDTQIAMKEYTLSYFLKTTSKGMKKK